MEKQQKRYSVGFKKEAVGLLKSSNQSLKQIAEELGVTAWSLREWQKQFGELQFFSLGEKILWEN